VRAPFRTGARESLESLGAARTARSRRSGRLGGDEFVALLQEVTSDEDAERVAGRILEAMPTAITIGLQGASSSSDRHRLPPARRRPLSPT
jgi:GGDEF domain-containing protein